MCHKYRSPCAWSLCTTREATSTRRLGIATREKHTQPRSPGTATKSINRFLKRALSERQLNYKSFSAYIAVLRVAVWGYGPVWIHENFLALGAQTHNSVSFSSHRLWETSDHTWISPAIPDKASQCIVDSRSFSSP